MSHSHADFVTQGVWTLREASMLKGAKLHACDLGGHSSFGGKLFTGKLMYDRRQPGKKVQAAMKKFRLFVCNECLKKRGHITRFLKVMKSGQIPPQLMKTKYFLRDLGKQLR